VVRRRGVLVIIALVIAAVLVLGWVAVQLVYPRLHH
jgi:hypothetical protein